MSFLLPWDMCLPEHLTVSYNAESAKEYANEFHEHTSLEIYSLSAVTPPDFVVEGHRYGILQQGVTCTDCLPDCALQDVKRVYSDSAEVVEPSKQGYMLTLRINFAELPQRKDRMKVISEISSLQAVILSSQMKDMLWNLEPRYMGNGMCNPIKIVHQLKEPFFVIKMLEKTTVIYPMRFKDDTDVILATSFFQELVDVSNLEAHYKAPRCTWSPIPPPELRGEPFQYLTTNGGFVSLEIFSQHIRGTKADNTVWNLLTFVSYVKYHVKCTRGFIQRKMRRRQESLTEVIRSARIGGDEDDKKHQIGGHKNVKKLMNFSRSKMFKKRYTIITNKIKKFHYRIRIKWLLHRFRRQWLRVQKIPLLRKYRKLD
ncbi:hypothetical protein C4D60_Mb04t21500 [Musa balbisiana]|uniref:Arp2/3 complex 34 kDa subunit n=1 Tax=Musa balbisiana TaxID=52838 RepID=A0A4S8KDM1_MUSBA|nr:hypothetical protein C4D60_Mb04t21500 [Musa balbisiana]